MSRRARRETPLSPTGRTWCATISGSASAAFAVTRPTRYRPRSGDRSSARRGKIGRMSCSQPKPWAVAPDRKSVGLGKSVSVRVALGGRRIIQKKKQKIYRYIISYGEVKDNIFTALAAVSREHDQ